MRSHFGPDGRIGLMGFSSKTNEKSLVDTTLNFRLLTCYTTNPEEVKNSFVSTFVLGQEV